MNKGIRLFDTKNDCCACGACMNICSKNAIAMKEDEYGFLYPHVDANKCINCDKCRKVCNYQHKEEFAYPQNVYAAMAKKDELLKQSASGGIFASIAAKVISRGGVAFGCSMEHQNGMFIPKHIMIEHEEYLIKLQGSKYVQSYMGFTYQNVKKVLQEGRIVFFSGTPCQVDGLKGFLMNMDYPNLFTIDIICHGVPNATLFNGYMDSQKRAINGKILRFCFRDKERGWSLKASVEYRSKNGNVRKKIIPVHLSSYYMLFLDAKIYRENCYSCKYAGKGRVGDITIGDFWGIRKEHPNCLLENGGNMDESRGISCVLVNTKQGQNMMEMLGDNLCLFQSTFENAAAQNDQLKHPCARDDDREAILNLYKESGYDAIDRWYYNRLGVKKYAYMLWNHIPYAVQRIIKKHIEI